MSRDSSHTYLHMHSASHADLFEDFCRPPSTTTTTNTSSTTADPSLQTLPGSFLPFESINLPPHLQPINPEDEDDVVPDMHAAFGIMRALGREGERGVAAEPVWRDFQLGGLVEGKNGKEGGPKREGKRAGVLLIR